ncbi:MAG: hypothetical protein AAFQ36_08445 [Pseudomonadota bacterium]
MTDLSVPDTTPPRSTLAAVVVLAAIVLASPFAYARFTAPPSEPSLSAEGAELVELAKMRPDLLAREMLVQVYQAFEARSEEAIYDALAAAVAGPVLEELYLQRRAALTTRDGAVQAVHDVTLNTLSATWTSDRSVVMEADWQILGTVGHAEHQHQRGNSYAATLTFTLMGPGFRVTEFDLHSIRRDENAGDVIEAPAE